MSIVQGNLRISIRTIVPIISDSWKNDNKSSNSLDNKKSSVIQ